MKLQLLSIALSAAAAVPAFAAQQTRPARACPVDSAPIAPGVSTFRFSGWAGPALPVHLYRPANAAADAKVVFVMHGVGRDGTRYRDEWRALADKHGFVVAVPEFDAKSFPESEGYNLGNILTPSGKPVPRVRWSFSAIEPIFDTVACRLGGGQRSYALYGHSAGGQFVHRFVQFVPDARYSAAVSANSGWYTLPDPAEAYPYGLRGAAGAFADPGRAFARPLTILLGTADTDRDHRSLRRTVEADRQGQTRFDRGHGFLANARKRAAALGVPLAWRIEYAPGVAHSNGGMAAYAVPHLLGTANSASADEPGTGLDSAAPARVASVAADPRVVAALAAVPALERDWSAQKLITLTEIPAPPFGEGPRGKAFADMLRAIGGTEVSIDAIGNVVARRRGRGGGNTVMVSAHLDTVFPAGTNVKVKRAGDRFIAPGIGDNSRGLVVLLTMAELMQKHRITPAGDILLVGTVGEEGAGDLRGMRSFFARAGHGIDRALVIDGGEIQRLIATAVGSHRYRITVSGPGGHSYGAFGTANPHHAAAASLAGFTRRASSIAKSGTKATYSVASLGGGTGVNVIPTESWFEIDMRSADAGRLDALDALLRAAVAEGVAAENAGRTRGAALTVAFKDLGKRPAGRNAPGSPLVASAAAAMAKLGVTPEYDASSTDANLPMSLGIPAVTISRGGNNLRSHSPDEEWIATGAHLGPQLALLTALAEAGLAPGE